MSSSLRRTAIQIVGQWMATEAFPDRMLTGTGRDRAFLTELIYGIVRGKRILEWMANACSDRSPSIQVLPALMVGIHQLLYMDGVPDYAAVSATVDGLRATTRNRGQISYVNAVLRRVIRERTRLLSRLAEQPLAVRESHPDLLVERWSRTFGPAPCAALCRWNNSRSAIVIRPRTGARAFDAYRRRLDAAGIDCDPHPHAPSEFLTIRHGTPVSKLPGFTDGACTVQDPATAASVDLLAPIPGERILDACAAPGGKTGLVADRMQNSGVLIASDIHADRIAILNNTLARLGLSHMQVVRADLCAASLPTPLVEHPFDGIMLDVPCSNTGVLRRRPDARWRFDPARLQHTVALQSELLNRVSGLLRPGGRLVYGTCSLEPEENREQIAAWLHNHPGFRQTGDLTLFPPESQTDGTYAVRLERVDAA